MKEYIPSIFQHIFNPDSRKVGFGWWLWIVASAALFVGTKITSEQWMQCSLMKSAPSWSVPNAHDPVGDTNRRDRRRAWPRLRNRGRGVLCDLVSE